MSDSKIEAAKTGRSKCRSCRQGIEKNELRMGVLSFQFDSDGSFSWFHLKCGAALHPESFETAVAEFDGEIPDLEGLREEARRAARKTLVPRIEAAPSGRAACQECGEKIAPKGTLRVVIEREPDPDTGLARPGYLHLKCALAHMAGEMPGIDIKELLLANSDLDEAQLAMVSEEL